MSLWEVRDESGLSVRVEAEDEASALSAAADLAPELSDGSVFPATDLAVGWDGDDAEG